MISFHSKKKKERTTEIKSKTYARLSTIFPRSVIKRYAMLLEYADMEDVDPRAYVGLSLTFPMMMGVLFFFITQFLGLQILWSAVAGVAVAVIIAAYFYLHLVLAADSRARRIEQILPDALQLVSANVRAGMTIDKALWLTARPELGTFEKELRIMAAQTLGGKPLKDALLGSGKRVKSAMFHRAMLLLVQGIQLGGELAGLLTEISKDIRQQQALRKEINAATTMYTLFIVFASVFAAPLLFAVSTFYVETTQQLWQGQIGSNLQGVGGNIGLKLFTVTTATITPDDVRLFSLAAIIMTTFFGALTLGLIRDGYAKRGLRLAPVFVSVALAVNFFGYLFIKSTFGSFLA